MLVYDIRDYSFRMRDVPSLGEKAVCGTVNFMLLEMFVSGMVGPTLTSGSLSSVDH